MARRSILAPSEGRFAMDGERWGARRRGPRSGQSRQKGPPSSPRPGARRNRGGGAHGRAVCSRKKSGPQGFSFSVPDSGFYPRRNGPISLPPSAPPLSTGEVPTASSPINTSKVRTIPTNASMPRRAALVPITIWLPAATVTASCAKPEEALSQARHLYRRGFRPPHCPEQNPANTAVTKWHHLSLSRRLPLHTPLYHPWLRIDAFLTQPLGCRRAAVFTKSRRCRSRTIR
jgi:hypothetical protein